MDVNVNRVGLTYDFKVTSDDYKFTGTCEKRYSTFRIEGTIYYNVFEEGQSNDVFLGNFNYNRDEHEMSFYMSTNNVDEGDSILSELVQDVILNIKDEIIE